MILTLTTLALVLFAVVVYLKNKNVKLNEKANNSFSMYASLHKMNIKVNLENAILLKNQTGFKEEITSLKEQLEKSIKKSKDANQELLVRGEEIKSLKEKLAEVSAVVQKRIDELKMEAVKENADQEVSQPVKPKRVYKKREKIKD